MGRVAPSLKGVRWWLDVQGRYADSAANTTIVRPGVGVTVAKDTTLWLGYAWVRTWLDDWDAVPGSFAANGLAGCHVRAVGPGSAPCRFTRGPDPVSPLYADDAIELPGQFQIALPPSAVERPLPRAATYAR